MTTDALQILGWIALGWLYAVALSSSWLFAFIVRDLWRDRRRRKAQDRIIAEYEREVSS